MLPTGVPSGFSSAKWMSSPGSTPTTTIAWRPADDPAGGCANRMMSVLPASISSAVATPSASVVVSAAMAPDVSTTTTWLPSSGWLGPKACPTVTVIEPTARASGWPPSAPASPPELDLISPQARRRVAKASRESRMGGYPSSAGGRRTSAACAAPDEPAIEPSVGDQHDAAVLAARAGLELRPLRAEGLGGDARLLHPLVDQVVLH